MLKVFTTGLHESKYPRLVPSQHIQKKKFGLDWKFFLNLNEFLQNVIFTTVWLKIDSYGEDRTKNIYYSFSFFHIYHLY